MKILTQENLFLFSKDRCLIMVKKGVIKKCCNMAMENILYEGTTDVDLFSRPFEIEMLKNSVKESRRQPKTGALKQAIEK